MLHSQTAVHLRFLLNSSRKASQPFLGNQSHGLFEGQSAPATLGSVRLRHSRVSNTFDIRTMEKLEELGDITRLSDHVVRVLGQNPGKFTLQGTNTYIIGSQNPYILIDTGEGLPAYTPILNNALEGLANPTQPDVSDVVLSHWHHDHVGGLPAVLNLLKERWESRNPGQTYTPPRLHKHPFKEDAIGAHHTEHNQLPKVLEKTNPELFTPPPNGGPFHDLADGQTFKDPVNGATLLRVLHTPGHTADSICLYIPQDRALYTADTVLGHGTAVFEDLASYLSSLNKMLHFGSASSLHIHTEKDIDLEYVSLYPAHGAIVSEGRETISTYIKHRLEREDQILAVIKSPVPAELLGEVSSTPSEDDNLWTTWTIVRVLYKAYPENLWLPAARGVDLHLRKLESDGLVKRQGGEGVKTKWRLLSSRNSPNL
ncbi:Metallo-hydrolase/oxidoreductase [Pholiota conissans]|uniref:Metallo-hydrolase/oxidoreductase n=1 Tax=Pholiota conissans TaxID=109636 RepID=A0A9P6D5W9_9AGAR|nr:Metallo-hydrolase/oxidoreductase [Pholiota conissans]